MTPGALTVLLMGIPASPAEPDADEAAPPSPVAVYLSAAWLWDATRVAGGPNLAASLAWRPARVELALAYEAEVADAVDSTHRRLEGPFLRAGDAWQTQLPIVTSLSVGPGRSTHWYEGVDTGSRWVPMVEGSLVLGWAWLLVRYDSEGGFYANSSQDDYVGGIDVVPVGPRVGLGVWADFGRWRP